MLRTLFYMSKFINVILNIFDWPKNNNYINVYYEIINRLDYAHIYSIIAMIVQGLCEKKSHIQ